LSEARRECEEAREKIEPEESSVSTNDTYRVEAAPLSGRLARGWHCLGPAEPFSDGKPHRVEAFNTEIVVFRTESGELAALDNFCPHMGASLAEGRVRGESIACPFHDWRWGADGRCTAIPYARRIPARARTGSWPLQVVNDVLYIWHEPEGNEPDVALSPIDEFDTAFSDWSYSSHRIHTNTRELVDNWSTSRTFSMSMGRASAVRCASSPIGSKGRWPGSSSKGGTIPPPPMIRCSRASRSTPCAGGVPKAAIAARLI